MKKKHQIRLIDPGRKPSVILSLRCFKPRSLCPYHFVATKNNSTTHKSTDYLFRREEEGAGAGHLEAEGEVLRQEEEVADCHSRHSTSRAFRAGVEAHRDPEERQEEPYQEQQGDNRGSLHTHKVLVQVQEGLPVARVQQLQERRTRQLHNRNRWPHGLARPKVLHRHCRETHSRPDGCRGGHRVVARGPHLLREGGVPRVSYLRRRSRRGHLQSGAWVGHQAQEHHQTIRS